MRMLERLIVVVHSLAFFPDPVVQVPGGRLVPIGLRQREHHVGGVHRLELIDALH